MFAEVFSETEHSKIFMVFFSLLSLFLSPTFYNFFSFPSLSLFFLFLRHYLTLSLFGLVYLTYFSFSVSHSLFFLSLLSFSSSLFFLFLSLSSFFFLLSLFYFSPLSFFSFLTIAFFFALALITVVSPPKLCLSHIFSREPIILHQRRSPTSQKSSSTPTTLHSFTAFHSLCHFYAS